MSAAGWPAQWVTGVHRAVVEGTVPSALQWALPALRGGVVWWRQATRDRLFQQATAMAYTTLVAFVPLLLLVFGIIGALGFVPQDRALLEEMLFSTFLTGIPEVQDFLVSGLERVNLAALGWIGVLGLVLAAGRLYLLIERAYNSLWGLRVDRPWGLRLLQFHFAVTALPTLVVASLSVMVAGLADIEVPWGRTLLEFALAFVVLLVALQLFPTTKVKWGPAALGALVSTVGLGFAQWLFQLYLAWFGSGDALAALYGSVALIPVVLLWLNLVWTLVLAGVETAYVVQFWGRLWSEERSIVFGLDTPLSLGVVIDVAAAVAGAFDRGEGPQDLSAVSHRTERRTAEVQCALSWLEADGVLARTDDGWLPAREPADVATAELVGCWSDHVLGQQPRPADQQIREAAEARLPTTLAALASRFG